METKNKTSPVDDKSVEFASESERALLSLGFKNQKILSEIVTRITMDFFLYPAHKIIFSALSSLLSQVDDLELDTLSLKCTQLGLSDDLRQRYLPLLVVGEFSESSLDFHLKEVKESYIKFSLCKVLYNNLHDLENNKTSQSSLSGRDILSSTNEQLSKIDAYEGQDETVGTFGDRARDLVMERAVNTSEILGLTTGFPTLDVALNGLLPSTLTIVGARMKVGKSTLLVNIANHISYATRQGSVLYLSTEMTRDEDLFRSLSMRTGVPEREIINGTAWHDPKKKELLQLGITELEQSPCQVYHEYVSSFSVDSIVARCKYWKNKVEDLRLIIFDYIKLPTDNSSNYMDSKEHQALGDLTNALKNNVAGEENIAVLTACQLGRTLQVADSDRLARYTNNLVILRRQTKKEIQAHGDFRTHGTHLLRVDLTRGGGSGQIIPIRFWQTILKMEEAETFDIGSDEDDDYSPVLHSPMEDIKKIAEDFKMPSNVSKEKLAISIEDLIGGADPQDAEKALKDQLGINIAKDQKN